MKQKLLFLLTALCFGLVSGVKADVVVPDPVYFNDFSSTEGLTVHGSGEFIDDDDSRFGKIFHNDPELTKAVRTNYLELPSDILSHSQESKAMTITFWVNKMDAADYWFSPIFTAYGNDNATESHAWPDSWWPFLHVQSRGILAWNSDGWCDFTAEQNDKESNQESTVWLDDAKWHLYTLTLTPSAAKIYIDGVVFNSWTIAEEGLNGFFTQTSLKHFYLGGNQAFGWEDPDPAYGFDDFAVYDAALSAEQIAQVMSNKLHYTVNAVDESSSILKVLADANSTSNSVEVDYPRFVLNESILRESAATSKNYKKTYTLTTGNQVENIEYTESTVTNVYYYAEGEDVLTTNRTLANQSLSMNKLGYTANSSTYTQITTLPAGTWMISARYFCGNKTGGHNAYIKVGDEVKWSQEYADGQGGNTEKNSETFTVNNNTVVSVAADGGSASGLDWIYIKRVGVVATIGATGWTTFASTYPLDLGGMSASTGDVKAYYASSVGDGKIVMTSTESEGVAAGTGLMLKGTAGATITIPVVASGDAISGNMLVGCTTETPVAASASCYVLVNNGGTAEFQSLSAHGATIPAGKAYLNTGVISPARLIISYDEEDPTGINAVEAVEAEAGALKDGKYLIGNKIVLVKNGVKYSANGQKLN